MIFSKTLSNKQADFLNKLLRYILSGGGAAIVDVGLFQLQVIEGVAVLAAAIISFCVAACFNYFVSSLFVFKTSLHPVHLAKFFIFSLIGLLTNSSITWIGFHHFQLYPALAKIIGIGCAFFVNFLVNYLVVFKKAHNH